MTCPAMYVNTKTIETIVNVSK